MSPQQPPLRIPLPLTALVLLAVACSRSSDAGSAGVPAVRDSTLLLVFDTSAGTTAEVRSRVAALAFEDEDGGLTANLVSNRPEVLLAHPLGRTSALDITSVPDGTYVALHLVLEEATAVKPDGTTEPATMFHRPMRISLGYGFAFPNTHPETLVLRHLYPVEPAPGSRARPAGFEARTSAGFYPLFDVRTRIHFTNVDELTATATIPAWGDAVAQLEFSEAVSLIHGGKQRSPLEFLERLSEGSELIVDAVLWSFREFSILAASDEIPLPPGPDIVAGGNRSEVTGVITELLAPDRFSLRVTGVRTAGDGFPSSEHVQLTVGVGGAIAWKPKLGPSVPVDFSALETGMQVDVSWNGRVNGNQVTAGEIGIRAADRSRLHSSWMVRVEAVDTASDTIRLKGDRDRGQARDPANNIPPIGFISTLDVELSPDTVAVSHIGGVTFRRIEPDDSLLGVDIFLLMYGTGNPGRARLLVAPPISVGGR